MCSDICTPPLGGVNTPPVERRPPPPLLRAILTIILMFFHVNLRLFTPPPKHLTIPLQIQVPRKKNCPCACLLQAYSTHLYVTIFVMNEISFMLQNVFVYGKNKNNICFFGNRTLVKK